VNKKRVLRTAGREEGEQRTGSVTCQTYVQHTSSRVPSYPELPCPASALPSRHQRSSSRAWCRIYTCKTA
jgi:hypothetical protein